MHLAPIRSICDHRHIDHQGYETIYAHSIVWRSAKSSAWSFMTHADHFNYSKAGNVQKKDVPLPNPPPPPPLPTFFACNIALFCVKQTSTWITDTERAEKKAAVYKITLRHFFSEWKRKTKLFFLSAFAFFFSANFKFFFLGCSFRFVFCFIYFFQVFKQEKKKKNASILKVGVFCKLSEKICQMQKAKGPMWGPCFSISPPTAKCEFSFLRLMFRSILLFFFLDDVQRWISNLCVDFLDSSRCTFRSKSTVDDAAFVLRNFLLVPPIQIRDVPPENICIVNFHIHNVHVRWKLTRRTRGLKSHPCAPKQSTFEHHQASSMIHRGTCAGAVLKQQWFQDV